jgi:ABC-2 type transport system ATP-binding protein
VIVEVNDIHFSYGSRIALAGVSFAVPAGSIFGILGPNGGGKSTLFRILSTLMAPQRGDVRIAGLRLATQPAAVRRKIGVVFQTQSLDRKLTVRENMESQGHLFGLHGAVLRERCDALLERLGLTSRIHELVGSLSGGLKRRVEIAKAMLHQPEVLLMDEPSTGLDPAVRLELWSYLQDLRHNQNVTILLTTHILEEADRCDRLLLLHEGRVVREGTPDELKSAVGGDVLSVSSPDPDLLYARITERFLVLPLRVNGGLRMEVGDGARFLTELLNTFPGQIDSVTMHRPTLEDVFLDETGTRLDA